ncbi:MAG: heparinase II/III family protein [Clostridium baratii]|uniref:Heparinase II/III-like family protein n=1 Tax=Clostridium baratii str. Sullivan TaxID=1415775 RepID=A0A0A7FRP5_9CLOT|nr:heparinase II/III family protein [Clostridium baratii]AIY82262.1 heparinase II/III-like family protein [Clostridium baratii str. Sullivan]MBS6006593.1 heparinase II/III family protein [Clostridium baratii]MDU1053735.1 heparinase II/III family protein [Clostridium baratii]
MRDYNKNIENLKIKVENYFNKYDKYFVIDYIKSKSMKEYNKKLIGAKLMMNNSFIFDNTWDMEQCNIPYRINPFKWDYTPNGDAEWTFMLNRHEYLNKLLMAYYIEKNDRYIEKLKWFIFNWIDNNEIDIKGGNTIRTIDTGIRCLAWIEILIHLIDENKLTDEEILKIIFSIKDQIEYLKKAYIGKYTLSNWGVLQTTSICSIYLWLNEFLEDEDLIIWAEKELYEQIDMQVFDDGSHWEQSIMYHVEVLNCSMKFINYSKKLGREIDNDFINKIESMAEYLMYSKSPKSTQEAQGDSDITDVRDVLVKAAVLFNNETLKWASFDNIDLMSIWVLGRSGYDKFKKLNKKEPMNKCRLFKDSGNIYIRDTFECNGNYTYLQNGTLGSGHGHTDLGHISIYYKGKPYIVDCGRYTYVEEDPLREYLKSYKAHNVCVIDKDPHGVPNKSWSYFSYGDCLKNYFKNKDNISYVEMPFIGELKNGVPYLINRKVLYIEPSIWVVINDVKCSGEHELECIYNLDNNVKVSLNYNGLDMKNGNNNLKIISEEKFKLTNGLLSKCYNKVNNNNKIVKSLKFNNKSTNYDIIIGDNIEVKEANIKQFNGLDYVDKEVAFSKEFIISKYESYIVIIFNKETYKGGKMYYYKDVPFYGKVIIIHKKGKDYSKIRLKA